MPLDREGAPAAVVDDGPDEETIPVGNETENDVPKAKSGAGEVAGHSDDLDSYKDDGWADEGGGAEADEIPAGGEAKEADPEAVATAVDLGMTKEFAEDLSKAGLLDKALGEMAASYASTGPEAMPGGKKPAPPSESEVPAELLAEPTPFELKLPTELGDLDPEVAKQFQAMNEHYAGQLKQQHAALKAHHALVSQMRGELDAFHAQAFNARVESWIRARGEDWKEVFGEKSISETSEKSKEGAAWARLLDMVGVLGAGFDRQGKQVPLETIFQLALNSTFADRIAAAGTRKVAQQLSGSKRRMTARPTAGETRTGPLKNADLIRRTKARMQERGIEPEY